jgi:hypothetical protein
MTTTPTTSLEHHARAALLDALHAQWRELGVPFHTPEHGRPLEVIDPEALLWCSLHFFESEPRLAEGVRSWFAVHRARVSTQRLNTLARRSRALSSGTPARQETGADESSSDPAWVAAWRGLQDARRPTVRANIGTESPSAATLQLRARDIFGNSCAAHFVVALLGSPRGVRCRAVAEETGFTYRAVANLAASWKNAGVVRLEHGFCTIIDPTPWARILRVNPEEIATVDWRAAYAAVLELLRELARARATGLPETHPLVVAAIARADRALEASAAGIAPDRSPTIHTLRVAIAFGRGSADDRVSA